MVGSSWFIRADGEQHKPTDTTGIQKERKPCSFRRLLVSVVKVTKVDVLNQTL